MPLKDQPADFNGTVGDFTIKAAAEPKQLTEDDLVTLHLTLEGKGAIDLAYDPAFPRSADFQVVGKSTKSTEKNNSGDGIGGRKTYEILLRPIAFGRPPGPRNSLSDLQSRVGALRGPCNPAGPAQGGPRQIAGIGRRRRFPRPMIPSQQNRPRNSFAGSTRSAS